MKTAVWIVTVCVSGTAFAQSVYLCQENGQGVYRERPSENCVESVLPPLGSYRAEYREPVPAVRQKLDQTKRRRVPQSAPAATAAVVRTEEPVRSGGRLAVARQELAEERAALKQAEQAWQQAKRRGDRVRQAEWESRIRDHRQTVRALQNEIGKL